MYYLIPPDFGLHCLWKICCLQKSFAAFQNPVVTIILFITIEINKKYVRLMHLLDISLDLTIKSRQVHNTLNWPIIIICCLANQERYP